MSVVLRNKIFYCMVMFVVFCNIPYGLQLNFIGSFLGKDLSLYPIVFSLIYYTYIRLENQDLSLPFKVNTTFSVYLGIYIAILMISFIHGLIIYPYYNVVLAGPLDQVEKLPIIQHFFSKIGLAIEPDFLLKAWMFARPIKGFILETFWHFFVPYLIFLWYKQDDREGFSILVKATFVAITLVSIYNVLDIFYLSGSVQAANLLKLFNPVIHAIQSNGSWWPPLLWEGQLRSLFAEPSYYGIFSAFAVPFIWYKFGQKTDKKEKIIIVMVLCLFTYGIFLTKSRTANILFLGDLLLLIFFSLWKRDKTFFVQTFWIIILSLTVFLCSVFSLNSILGSSEVSSTRYDNESSTAVTTYIDENIKSATSNNKRSNGARFSILEANIAIGRDHLLLGVGKSLRDAYIPDYLSKRGLENEEVQYWLKNQKEKGVMKAGIPELGEYSTRFAETGILGLFIYLLPSVYLAFQLLRIIHNTDNRVERAQCIFFFISLAGVMASGLGDSLSVTCAYWIIMGIGYALISSVCKKEQHEAT